jgi:hypothetical protein
VAKPHGAFNKRKLSPDGLQPLCRECQKTRDNAKYHSHPESVKDRVRSRTLEHKFRLDQIKTEAGCMDCGMKGGPGYLYDFDHQRDKVEDVSRMLSHTWESILDEVAKCQIVCGNCHRKRTYLRKYGTLELVIPSKAQKDKRLIKTIQRLTEFKSRPCMDCGGSFHFSAMDCDHRDPLAKSGEPSNIARNGTMAALEIELDKCDVVCSNCHRKRTAVDSNYEPPLTPPPTPSKVTP